MRAQDPVDGGLRQRIPSIDILGLRFKRAVYNKVIYTNSMIAVYHYGYDLTDKEVKTIIGMMEKSFHYDEFDEDNMEALRRPSRVKKVLTIVNAVSYSCYRGNAIAQLSKPCSRTSWTVFTIATSHRPPAMSWQWNGITTCLH